jgi:heptosyltransferase-2
MLDMRWNNQRYKLFITDANMSYANILKKSINTNTVIGLVISAGNRWPMKTLAIDQQIKLLKDLYKKYGKSITLILLYGHSELEKSYVEEIRRECPYVMTHEVQELRKFIGIVNICDIIITPDTLSMHISIALNKYVVAYFTVTSAAEIELYTGKKIIANHHDYCTYIKELKPRPNITDSINIQDIVLATEKLINNNR